MSAWTESWMDSAAPVNRRAEALVRFIRTSTLELTSLAERGQALLGREEKGAFAHLTDTGSRRDAFAAHLLARLMLAERVGCEPARIVIGSSSLGKPVVLAPAAAARFNLSLSHTDGVALCGISEECDVGVEVGSLREVGSNPVAAAESLFSRRELAVLRALDPGLRAGHYLMLWTRMEAFAKARGSGMSTAAGAHATDAGTAWRPAGPMEPDAAAMGFPGRIESWRITRDHVAAVAILGRPRTAIGIRLEEAVAELPDWVPVALH